MNSSVELTSVEYFFIFFEDIDARDSSDSEKFGDEGFVEDPP